MVLTLQCFATGLNWQRYTQPSSCARDSTIGVYCAEAEYYTNDLIQILSTVCATPVSNQSAACLPECATSLQAIRDALGCCINAYYNVTGPSIHDPLEVAFSYSLWSRCNVTTVNSTCGGALTYEIPNTIPSTCTTPEVLNNIAAGYCTAGEQKL